MLAMITPEPVSDAGPVVPSTPAGGDGGPVGAEAALSFRAAYARSLDANRKLSMATISRTSTPNR